MQVRDILSEDVGDFLPKMFANALKAEEIYTLNHLKDENHPNDDALIIRLLKIPNIGKKSIRCLEDFLTLHNLTIKDLLLTEEERKEFNAKRVLEKLDSSEKIANNLEKKVKALEARMDQLFETSRILDERMRKTIDGATLNGSFDKFREEMNKLSLGIAKDINNKLIEFHKDTAILEHKIKGLSINEDKSEIDELKSIFRKFLEK